MSEEDDMTGHTTRPSANGVSLREFFTLWIEGVEKAGNERGRRLEELVKHEHEINSVVSAANKDAVTAAFAATKEAGIKLEAAQNAYNTAHNDRMPRPEAESKFKMLEDKVAELREWKGERGGAHSFEEAGRSQNNWLVGLIVGAALGGLALLVSVANVAYGMASK